LFLIAYLDKGGAWAKAFTDEVEDDEGKGDVDLEELICRTHK